MIDDSVSSVTSSLLTRAKNLDDDAWRRLVRIYSPLIYGWCRKSSLNREDAADVGQNIWVKVHNSLDTFQLENFRGWIRTITKNEIKDHWKRIAKQGNPLPLNGWDARFDRPGDSDLAEETKLLYRNVLDLVRTEFSDVQWQAFWKTVAEACDPKEVAQELGITRNQVYLAKSRILRRVRETFDAK